ncbi:MAG: hypothetical protein WAU88_14845, partial [Candidatus Zixiibacteriota bacterium]
DIRLYLISDGSFYQTWHGCMGLYGESAGGWRLKDSLVLLSFAMKTDVLTDFPESLLTLSSKGTTSLLPISQKYAEPYRHFGASNGTLLQKDSESVSTLPFAIADIDCDGIGDLIVGTNSDSGYVVRVYLSPMGELSKDFHLKIQTPGNTDQLALCGYSGDFAIESGDALDSLKTEFPDGYVPDHRCSGIDVYSSVPQCDHIHIFWNHKMKKLDWMSHKPLNR